MQAHYTSLQYSLKLINKFRSGRSVIWHHTKAVLASPTTLKKYMMVINPKRIKENENYANYAKKFMVIFKLSKCSMRNVAYGLSQETHVQGVNN